MERLAIYEEQTKSDSQKKKGFMKLKGLKREDSKVIAGAGGKEKGFNPEDTQTVLLPPAEKSASMNRNESIKLKPG